MVLLDEFFSEFRFMFSVIMLSETWSTSAHNVFRMTNYKTYYLNRPVGRGGGVALLLNENVTGEMLNPYSVVTPDYEIISLCAKKCIYSVCYRPPSGDLSVFLKFYEHFLSFVADGGYTLIAGGDFNIDMSSNNFSTREFRTVLASNGFISVIEVPTRVTTGSQSTLDLFITNLAHPKIETGALSCSISDHLPVFLCMNEPTPTLKEPEGIRYQRITSVTLKAFRDALKQVDLAHIAHLNDANEVYNKFLGIFKQLYQLYFPSTTYKASRKTRKPWINHELRKEIKMKNKLYRTFLTTRSVEDLRLFKEFRNKLTKKLRSARTEYYSAFLDVKKGRHDVVWTRLNSLLHRNQSHGQVRNLKIDDKELSGTELANAFNDFFTKKKTDGSARNACDYLDFHNDNTIFLEPVTTDEVASVILSLKNSSSRDIDDIQIKPIKYVADIIAPAVAHIFNVCLATSVFPEKMQIAKITVLFKKGDRNDLGNYRPISVLPVFSKALEKILHSRLNKFLDKYNLLTPYQFGFRKNKSTELALLEQKEYILTQFEHKELVIGIFIDFSKAFDLVNHKLLLEKLWHYGIRGQAAELIKSYLSKRKQTVNIDNTYSEIKEIYSGVPQGSILGPLLFNIYLNDIVNINPNVRFIIYADDTSIFFSGSNIHDLIQMCNTTMITLERWSQSNYMRVNEKKTKAVIFRPRNKPITPHDSITFNSREIEIVDHFKCLGAVFSSHMSWEDHTNHVVRQLARVTGTIGCIRYILPKSIKLLLYNTLFCAHINYCQLVWGTATYSSLQKIYVLQKKFLRYVFNADYGAPSKAFFRETGIIKIFDLYQYRLSVRFKLETKNNINYIRRLANLKEKEASYPFREPETWLVPTPRINTGKQRLQYRLPSLLNTYKSANFNLSTCTNRELRCLYIDCVTK